MENISDNQQGNLNLNSETWESLDKVPFHGNQQEHADTQNLASEKEQKIATAFNGLCDRFNLSATPKTIELLGNILGGETKRQEILDYQAKQTDLYEKWNAKINAEHIRRRCGNIVWDLFPNDFGDFKDKSFDELLMAEEKVRRQILSAPEVKALSALDDRYERSYQEFVAPTPEDVESPTFEEYKKSH